MKCTNCGFESELNHSVCPQCQTRLRTNPAAQKILHALKDPLFLIICILISVSCVLSLTAGSIPLINILLTVFLWLTYAQSRKDMADANHLRSVSGTVYANYVITYVSAGLLVVIGVIFSLVFGYLASDPAFLESLLSGFADVDYASVVQMLGFIPSGLFLVIFIFAAAMVIVLNIFSMRYIHRFAKSVYQSIEKGVLELKHTTAAKVWLFIYGGCAAISCLGSLTSLQINAFLSNAAGAAACIIAGLLINKYLSDGPVAPQNDIL